MSVGAHDSRNSYKENDLKKNERRGRRQNTEQNKDVSCQRGGALDVREIYARFNLGR